nr:hypothetical protein CFP56_27662 [Quercus suber]
MPYCKTHTKLIKPCLTAKHAQPDLMQTRFDLLLMIMMELRGSPQPTIGPTPEKSQPIIEGEVERHQRTMLPDPRRTMVPSGTEVA